MLAGPPDYSPDIFPALMTRSRSASICCTSQAFQMPRFGGRQPTASVNPCPVFTVTARSTGETIGLQES